MFKIAKPFYIRTISSLHAGSGNDLGIVDLPIQREKHTSFPKIESSSLKGALREAFETKNELDKQKFLSKLKNSNPSLIDFGQQIDEAQKIIFNFDYAIHLAFGYDESYTNENIKAKFGDDTEFAGALGFSDARILFFPIKSAKGVFAWVTCPMVLKRFKEEMELCEMLIPYDNIGVNSGECIVDKDSKVLINEKSVVLEEYFFEAKKDDSAQKYNLIPDFRELKDRIVILNDDDFKDFVNLSTEVITRTKIDNATGTVAQGALFNEEYLPPETIMYYLVFASPIFQKDDSKKGIFKMNGKSEEQLVLEFFENNLPEVIQIGGNATIGKGIVKTKSIIINNSKGGN